MFLITIAFDVTGFRNPPSSELRHVNIRSTDTGTICEPAHGDTRTGREPFLKETRWLIAATQPDTREEQS